MKIKKFNYITRLNNKCMIYFLFFGKFSLIVKTNNIFKDQAHFETTKYSKWIFDNWVIYFKDIKYTKNITIALKYKISVSIMFLRDIHDSRVKMLIFYYPYK